MFKLEGIAKTYGGSGKKAVDSLDLEIRKGEIFGFLGPNGAGKTTTIRILTGVLRPDAGRVTLDGIDLEREPLRAKARFGAVPDDPELWNRLKAREYLDFMGDVYGVPTKERRERIAELAARFALAEVLGSSIGSFSRGMKQKLCVIGSLLHEPANWILDEPMVGLDPQASFDLKALMRKRADAGGSVFFSTHVLEVAERICDRIGVIAGGRLLFAGSIEELRSLRAATRNGAAIAGGDGAGKAPAAAEGTDASLESLFLELVEGGPS
ncbi:MAG TPA: ABC transporter ATP-binding protein [Rectinemataceae bacterium]|nr:ABC transporter ATP-binding protein [Rectinemataceae bacterium]